jgi:hypothetical protein
MEDFKVINLVFSEPNSEEYLLLEFQGNIQHTVEKKFYLMYLGNLNTLDKENYSFNIGNHQLLGKKSTLKNPILVCQKSMKNDQNKINIIHIITSKVIFFNRPTPVLNNTNNSN